MKRSILLAVGLAILSGCASTAQKNTTEQAYMIIDVKGDSSIRERVLNTVVSSVEKSMDTLTVSRGIPPAELPEKATRFKLTSPFGDSAFGALVQSQGGMIKVPSCQDPLLTMKSDDSTEGFSEKTSFFICVVQYQQGYHVDIYSTFQQSSGGLSVNALSASLARSIVGDTSQIIPRTMKRVELALSNENLETKVVDSYIPSNWKGAFVNETKTN
ncbi:lipoprotein [Shewanella alkalitolerans]|uniref:lipoprotein n=1 Tax=Shewanella alkalitolerans TaxID=2864209 RepID=UPI001C65C7E0|nr:lipoprotein [Shewanella alkalitolerans]QYJ98131.1 lipoprotein [Shewanella alkalitolerans]